MRDEYFCPNCNAILNDQYGFDPDKGSWTCTECGTHLMDDDVYEGDSFEGVAWYCDDCGALLNRQSGFYDYYGSWKCTECGHWNSISEDDIVDSEEEGESTYSASYTPSRTYNSTRKTSSRRGKNSFFDEADIFAIKAIGFFLAIAAFCLFISFLYELQ